MNELFRRVPIEEERLKAELERDDDEEWIQEWRFTGDCEAFVNSDFRDFMSLLDWNVLWFNKNLFALCKDMSDPNLIDHRIPDRITWINRFTFDQDSFTVGCLDEPNKADTSLSDMLLESQGRRKIRQL
jgi:hypothetical protein